MLILDILYPTLAPIPEPSQVLLHWASNQGSPDVFCLYVCPGLAPLMSQIITQRMPWNMEARTGRLALQQLRMCLHWPLLHPLRRKKVPAQRVIQQVVPEEYSRDMASEDSVVTWLKDPLWSHCFSSS